VKFPFICSNIPQHWHMQYISLRWYDIPELVAPIRMSLIEDAANKEATATRVPFGKVEVITSKILRLPPCRGWPLWNICVTTTTDMFHLSKHFLVLSVFTLYYRVFNRLTRRVPLVELDQHALLEHLISPQSLVGFVLLER
jgi:hypothetical protein